MFIASTTQTNWRSPRLLLPLLQIGRYSYEIYLTHMFVVFTLFGFFLSVGKPMRLVPVLFVSTILISGLLGAVAANLYSERMNRFLRGKSASIGRNGPSTAYALEEVENGAVAP